MAQQKSEDRVVPEGGVMPVERAGSSPGGQGKAVPVEETAVQLSLPIVTAENPKGATRRRSRDRLGEIRAGAPKAIGKVGTASSATMEEVAYRLTDALLKVASNKGAPGPDGQTIDALADQWSVVLPRLRADLLAGRYEPGGIRRVFIPKAGGGQRGLGIPDVIDRIVQEAVRQVLEPLWEPTFHPSNHGFRLGRSCHTAIAEAKGHLEDGYEWGNTLVSCIAQFNAWLRGWHGFFGIASASEMQAMRKLDAHIRRRLRAILLRHWKRKRTIADRKRVFEGK